MARAMTVATEAWWTWQVCAIGRRCLMALAPGTTAFSHSHWRLVLVPDASLLPAGGSCFDLHPSGREGVFVVGTAEGHVYKCSTAYTSQYLQVRTAAASLQLAAVSPGVAVC